MATILVVDDDAALQRAIGLNLRARGHDVLAATTGRGALAAFQASRPDLVILDLGLPDLDGTVVLRRLRVHAETPVIVLSARHDAAEKVAALDDGADDYVTKPFSMDELVARVRRALSRTAAQTAPPAPLRGADGLVIDFAGHLAARGGAPIHLTPIEWRLLAELARHEGGVVPHAELLRAVWGQGYETESHYLRVFVSQLRRKLEADPAAPVHLVNEAGLGYRLVT